METISATKHRIPTTLSVRSLDVGQLIAANVAQNSSLLSESVTYASDLSDGFSETLPAFPTRLSPGFATVSLGEHLKMFPSSTPTTGSRIMLASPTSPRLRSMFKECLSISKWAEYSMGWDAPGHVPWENKLEFTSRKWLPEGSLFSSESFSRALFHSRNWRTVIGSDFSCLDGTKLGDLNSEMIEMMRELHNLRSYFAETLRDDAELDFHVDSAHMPPVPALVVSTSYMTVPWTSLESSQDLSPNSAFAMPSLLGDEPLPPLVIQNENIPRSIKHPDSPTSTLGCQVSDDPDDRSSVLTTVDNPELCVEDMITNLRLQCSHMSPPCSLPVDDTSWNSRSPMPLVSDDVPHHPNAVNMQTPSKSSMEPGDGKEAVPTPTPRLKGKTIQSKANYKKRTSTDLSNSQPPLTRKSSKSSTTRHVSSKPTRAIVQKIPRSAMAKGVDNRSQKPYKMVRFALPKSEVEEDFQVVGFTQPSSMRRSLSTSTTGISDDPDSKVSSPKTIRTSPPVRMSSMRKDSGGVLVSESLPLRHSKVVRTRSVTIAPFRKVALARESIDLKPSRPEPGSTTHVRRSHTLSVHPFSRIMKRPMLALKDANKRATIAVDSAAFSNTDDVKRRMSTATVQGNSRKNRIRSLLTRFK